jgi:group I intron endonuclease
VYCENEKTVILKSEQYIMDLLKPEYNLTLVAGSPLGYKHSEETKLKMSARIYTKEIKQKMRDGAIGRKHSIETCLKIRNSQPNSKKIEVTDLETKITTSYNSICEAAKALNIKQCIISGYFSRNQSKPYKGRYVFSLGACID